MGSIIQELKDAINKLQIERDIIREIATDLMQFSGNITRSQADDRMNREIFQRLQREDQIEPEKNHEKS